MTEDRRRAVSKAASFEDLEVFKRAYRLSLEIHRASLKFPALEQRTLADQVRRASKSICANLAEGFAKQRQSRAEFNASCRWRSGRVTRCAYGCAIASTWATSVRSCGNGGAPSIARSRVCC